MLNLSSDQIKKFRGECYIKNSYGYLKSRYMIITSNELYIYSSESSFNKGDEHKNLWLISNSFAKY